MREFYWPRDRTPGEEPLWVRLYGKDEGNRPDEEHYLNAAPDGLWFCFRPNNKDFPNVAGRFRFEPLWGLDTVVLARADIVSPSPGNLEVSVHGKILLMFSCTSAGVQFSTGLFQHPLLFRPTRARTADGVPAMLCIERILVNVQRPRSKDGVAR